MTSSKQYEQSGSAAVANESVETESFEPTIVRLSPKAALQLFKKAGEDALEASDVRVQSNQTE